MVTISDVAKMAGVSPVTVSRVINNTDYVNTKTREKVLAAIEELGYIPSAIARGLRINRSFTIALIVPDITNPFWTTVSRGVEDAAQGNKYSVLLCNVDEDAEKQTRALATVLSQQVDGVMIAPHSESLQHLVPLRLRNIPTVVLDRRLEMTDPDWQVDFVSGDSISGAYALTRHLLKLGHRRIAMLSGNLRTSTAQDRVQGYRMALEDAGIAYDDSLVLFGEYRVAAGEELTRRLLNNKLDFSCIFAANNAIGMGVARELVQRDIHIPDEVALVFYDDYAYAGNYFPFFTVVTQPAYDIGRIAVEMLISRMTAQHTESRKVVLPSKMLVRYSCGARKNEHQVSPLNLPLLPWHQFQEDIIDVEPMRKSEG